MQVDQEYEVVRLGGDEDALREHPQNPRRGDVEAIDESIRVSGWYGAIVAQRSTGYILAGNHRFRAAVARGATEIPVIWRDVGDEAAVRILLADNKTADLGGYDEETLTALLDGLETLEGTGYGRDAVQEAEEEDAAEETDEEPEVPDDKYTPQWAVMVLCESESHQAEVYGRLAEEGFELKVVAV